MLEVCQCTPYFHWAGVREYRDFCRGASLVCQNEIFSKIGEFTEVEAVDDDDVTSTKTCLAACEDQQNNVAMTTSRIPNRQTLVEWPDFCLVVKKLHRVCNKPWKRVDLDASYPRLCSSLLSAIQAHFGAKFKRFPNDKACRKMFNAAGLNSLFSAAAATDTDGSRGGNVTSSEDDHLLDSIFRYSRDNLALVNIYIKPPVVTRILRDQRIPIIWFVANCGGILGLCMGFSIVTVFEVLHFVLQTLMSRATRGITRGQASRKSRSSNTLGTVATGGDTAAAEQMLHTVASFHDVSGNTL